MFSIKNDLDKLLPYERLQLGNCIDQMRCDRVKTYDCVITDPPFGINLNEQQQMYARKTDKVINEYREIAKEDYASFTMGWIKQATRLIKPNGSLIIVSGWSNLADILNALKYWKYTLINHIIWKYQFSPFTKKKFSSSHQHILFAVKNKKKYTFNKPEHYALDVWDIKRTYNRGVYRLKTQMCDELATKLIKCFTNAGDVVLDPFAGSGTTMRIGNALGRICWGYEINWTAFNVAQDNLGKTNSKS